MWFKKSRVLLKFAVLYLALEVIGCEAITNSDFNGRIRDYAVVEDSNFTLAGVKTLQKQGAGLSRYASYAPEHNPVKLKDFPDSTVSGSIHGRRLLHQDHTGFGYEEPYYGNGFEYQHNEAHAPYDPHQVDFHAPAHPYPPVSYHGYGYHHKHYDHGLATKALLWPIAGIALLGAAAALVTNPVLLQLGVVSGKRRRRHIEEIENTAENSIRKWSEITTKQAQGHDSNLPQKITMKRIPRKNEFKTVKRVLRLEQNHQFKTENNPLIYSEEDRRFIPIPLKMKENVK